MSTDPLMSPKPPTVRSSQRVPLGREVLSSPMTEAGRTWYAQQVERTKQQKERSRKSRLANTWAGIAVEGGGHFVFAGKTSYGGRLWNLGDTDRWCTFKCEVRTFGLALGGKAGLHLIFFFNTKSLDKIEGSDFGNGGNLVLDIPVTRLKKLAEGLQKVHTLIENANLFREVVGYAESLTEAFIDKKPTVISKSFADAGVGAGFTYGIQGKIDILAVQGKRGYVDDL